MSDPTPDQDPQALLCFNGINGATGAYDLPPMTVAELARFVQGEAAPENLAELRHRSQAQGRADLGVGEGVDPRRLDQTGWGLILAHDADPAIKEALTPLLKLRQSQAGERFRVYEGSGGHRPDETKTAFLARYKVGPGPVDPAKVPYYLLIAGSPERIPFRFQSQLDVQFSVGRIHFATLDEYANYARSVVEAETRPLKLARQVRFFGVANPRDQATNLSAKHLVTPLQAQLGGQLTDWNFDTVMGEGATKARLARLLGGEETPALLFTASHGMGFPLNDPRQLPHQGALLCQNWPGPAFQGAIPQDFYFAGDDLTADTDLQGLIAFFFACYGGGTPDLDEFAKQAFKEREPIAPRPFLAGLPTRMLGLPRGGALAVIGHVERAWTYSFQWQKAGNQTEVFRSTLHRLLDGYPVGAALEYFNERYAELSTVLSDELEEIGFGKQSDPYDLAGLWTANNDARGFSLIGDPAVRLPVAKPGEGAVERRPLVVQPFVPAPPTAPTAPATGPGAHPPSAPPAPNTAQPPTTASPAAGPADSAGAFAVTGQVTGGGTADDLSITTWLVEDPTNPDGRTLVARTRVAVNGAIETQIAGRFCDSTQLLGLHRGLVEQALAGRRAGPGIAAAA